MQSRKCRVQETKTGIKKGTTIWRDGYSMPVEDFVRQFNEANFTNFRVCDLVHISFNPMDEYIELVFDRKD